MNGNARRVFGVLAVLAGISLLVWSYCPLVIDFLDYTGLANTWNYTCPSKVWSKALFIGAVILLVVGQRLLSGRTLHTGERID